MVKINRPGSHKTGSGDAQANTKQQQAQPASPPPPAATPTPKIGKGKNQHKVGGTAVHGAKSLQPKELSVGKPAQNQEEYYNRETRRRMQQMKTGPYAEHATVGPRERRQKRQEKLKERQDRMKQLVDARGPSRDIKIGKRNTYFLIALIAILVIAFVVAIIKYALH